MIVTGTKQHNSACTRHPQDTCHTCLHPCAHTLCVHPCARRHQLCVRTLFAHTCLPVSFSGDEVNSRTQVLSQSLGHLRPRGAPLLQCEVPGWPHDHVPRAPGEPGQQGFRAPESDSTCVHPRSARSHCAPSTGDVCVSYSTAWSLSSLPRSMGRIVPTLEALTGEALSRMPAGCEHLTTVAVGILCPKLPCTLREGGQPWWGQCMGRASGSRWCSGDASPRCSPNPKPSLSHMHIHKG